MALNLLRAPCRSPSSSPDGMPDGERKPAAAQYLNLHTTLTSPASLKASAAVLFWLIRLVPSLAYSRFMSPTLIQSTQIK